MKINDALFGVLLVVLGAVVLVHVQAYPKIPGQQYGAALFPGLIAAGFVLCGALLVVNGIRTRAGARWFTAGAWMQAPRQIVAFVALIAGVAAYIVLADTVGFLLLAPVLLIVWFVALGVRWTTAIMAALITTIAIWYSFYKLLRVPLPWGWLTPFAF